jgi:D-lactate dehydrogenase (cytochrome)
MHLRRGGYELDAERLVLGRDFGQDIDVPIVPVPIPKTKHTAGYYIAPDMDPIDLFIGGEGTLIVVTEAVLKLAPVPAERLSLFLFLPEDEPSPLVTDLLDLAPAAIEYMDKRSLDLLRTAKDNDEDAGAVPDMPEDTAAALYVELEGDDDEDIDGLYGKLDTMLQEYSIPEECTWAGFDAADLEAMKAFRHALPERINTIIGQRKRDIPELAKVGTDMAVPVAALEKMLNTYSAGLENAGLEYCIFGHIGNAHLHVNILPRSMDEIDTAYGLYINFAKEAVRLGGSVAGEHGIGRLKTRFMPIQYSASQIEAFKQIKSALDPGWMLNPGVIFE